MDRREFVGFAALMPLIASIDRVGATVEKGFVLLPDSGRVYDVGRGEGRILVGAEQSGGEWWLGSFRNDAGRITSLHVHHSMDEQFYGLEGVISLWMNGRWHDLPPGALAVVPRNTPHALGNWSKQQAHFLNSGNPAGFERFFADINETIHRAAYGSQEFFAVLKNLYPKYGSEMLGPPPQR